MVLTTPQLTATLDAIVKRLRESFSPSAIYLYGSYAYGSPASHSDLDILVVVAESSLSAYQRDAQAYLALIDVDTPLDVQVYTRSEFEERAALPVSFERTVRQKGKLIYAE